MDDEDVLDLAAGVGLFIASVDSPRCKSCEDTT